MAVTIAELLAQREQIKARRHALYDIETSVGIITCSIPDAGLVSEAWDLSNNAEGNKYLVYQCVKEPNLKSEEVQKAFRNAGMEPFDVVDGIFQAGEISAIAGQLLKLAGFGGNITAKLHSKIKN